MHVVVAVSWQVIVHDVVDARQVQASGCHVRGHQDGGATTLEVGNRTITLHLGDAAVHGNGLDPLIREFPGDLVDHRLLVCEDNGLGRPAFRILHLTQSLHELCELVAPAHVLESLVHVGRRGTHLANSDPVVGGVKEVQGHVLHLTWERGGEHHGLSALGAWLWHAVLLHNAANLRLKSHVQHSVSLVECQKLDILHGEDSALQEILQTSWRGDHNLCALSQCPQLWNSVRAAVDRDDTSVRPKAKPSSLHCDLLAELTGWCQDNTGGARWAFLQRRPARVQRRCDDGHQECSCLAAASLGAHHHVAP
mmetsp:Transcript_76453/g.123642  ORF Transcript_76453/g.123642 Transcript_76453/m.123642 type:complete len:309 (-) Transcript_76453:692-1618(-)